MFRRQHMHSSKCCHYFYTPPRNEVRGVYWNHHVRLSSAFGFPAFGFPMHNNFLFTPIIMKLHMQTPHESRMCPIDFEVKRSKVKVTMHKFLKIVPAGVISPIRTDPDLVTSGSHTLLTVSLNYQRKFNIGRHVLLLYPLFL